MRNQIAARALPGLLVLMAIAVILILGGAANVGLTLGLVVAGTAGILLVSMLLYDVANSQDRDRPREDRVNRQPHAKGF